MGTAQTPRPNPFVGPRPFEPGETLYGRDREARDLQALLVAERIVLLYSPSGAGKTSLVQAALIPRLIARDFFVRPIVRVNLAPQGAGNRYLRSTLAALDDGLPEAAQLPPDELAALSLDAYLARRPPPAEADGEVLIFDQFEEILTADPTDEAGRLAFFAQLGEALRRRSRWALFMMREDYIAGLDPYLLPIPTRLNSTYRLDLLSVPAAQAVLAGLAAAAGVAFEPAAAASLAADLSRTTVQKAGGDLATRPGPTVEPVQLQVVCRRLWEGLPPGATRIGTAEVAALGDVDEALGDYYGAQVARAAQVSAVPERAVRQWFDRRLITPQGIRGAVLQGTDDAEGLPVAAVAPLRDAYLVRGERRRGATWLELAHDRLVEPVRRSNAAWLAANLSTLQRQADLWEQQGRPAGLLLRDAALAEAEAWARANPQTLSEGERDFLGLCQEARDALERERRQARRIRSLAIGASVLSIVALAAFFTALWFFNRAERQARANSARALAAAAVASLPGDPARSVLLADASVAATAAEGPLPEAMNALYLAVAESRLTRVLAGHERGLTSVSYAPDGAALATGSNDGAVKIWPLAGGEPQTFAADGAVNDVAYSPDGASIASAELSGDAGLVRLWGVDGTERWAAPLEALPTRLGFSPDGTTLAVATGAGAVVLLATADGAEVGRLSLPAVDAAAPPISDVAYSPDGARILAVGDAGLVALWPAAGGDARLLAGPHTGLVEAAAWSPDGATFATADDDGLLVLWDAAGATAGEPTRTYGAGFYDVSFSPDGLLVATASPDGTARLWQAADGAPLLTLAGHSDYVTGVAFAPDGRQLATASLDHSARLWSLDLVPPDGLASLAFSPDGATLATAGYGTARLWERATGAQTRVLTASDEGELVASLAYSPDGARLAAAVGSSVRVWETATWEEQPPLAGHAGDISSVAWSPAGDRLASVGDDLSLRVWDVTTGAELYAVADHGDSVASVAWSADGGRIATCDRAGGVFVRDAATGAALLGWELSEAQECNVVTFSPDGARVATADPAGLVLIWQAATGAELLRLAHPPDALGVVFSPDGATIYTGGSDRQVRLWDAASGEARGAIALTAAPAELRVSADRAGLAVAGADNLPRLLPLALDDLLALARARAVRPPTPAECATYGPLPECGQQP